MSDTAGGSRRSEPIESQLKALREDYANVTGIPFEHFYCPILFEDAPAPLCMGHIVNESCPNSFRGRVVQRADVDNFFGSLAEADFTSLIQAQSMHRNDVLYHPTLSKKLRPKITVDGKEWKHYQDRGPKAPDHSRLAVQIGGGEPMRWVLRKSPEDVNAALKRDWKLVIEMDCRVSALISLIKAAHLSLFRLLGYSYVLSGGGIEVGNGILGRFYRAHRDRQPSEAKAQALAYFRDYVNMVRPIEGFTGERPRGTVEDSTAKACFTSSGRPFALVVCVRTSQQLHAVMMPVLDHADGAAAYMDFMRNDNTSVRLHGCAFDAEARRWLIESEPTEVVWPKNGATFEFE
jgi:hypothetical protein